MSLGKEHCITYPSGLVISQHTESDTLDNVVYSPLSKICHNLCSFCVALCQINPPIHQHHHRKLNSLHSLTLTVTICLNEFF